MGVDRGLGGVEFSEYFLETFEGDAEPLVCFEDLEGLG